MFLQWLRKDERGFTLVELMMVIVILGVLAGVAVPITSTLRRNAAKAKLAAYADSWAQAIMMLAVAEGALPAGTDATEVKGLLSISDTDLQVDNKACDATKYCLTYKKDKDDQFTIKTWNKGADAAAEDGFLEEKKYENISL